MKARVTLLVILTLVFSVMLVGCGSSNSKPEAIDRVAFAQTFKSNPAKAMEEYGNKPFVIVGKVLNIGQDYFYLSYFVEDEEINYKSGHIGMSINVKAKQNDIAKISQGELVSVTGKFTSMQTGVPAFEATSISEASE